MFGRRPPTWKGPACARQRTPVAWVRFLATVCLQLRFTKTPSLRIQNPTSTSRHLHEVMICSRMHCAQAETIHARCPSPSPIATNIAGLAFFCAWAHMPLTLHYFPRGKTLIHTILYSAKLPTSASCQRLPPSVHRPACGIELVHATGALRHTDCGGALRDPGSRNSRSWRHSSRCRLLEISPPLAIADATAR